MQPSERLAELQLVLPKVAAPVANYIPANRSGNLIFSSGQVPFKDGKVVYVGKVPTEVTLTQAADAARIAMLNAIAACAQIVGGVDAISRVVRVVVFVNSDPTFTEHPKVANGASDLLVQIFGDQGRHARSALGAAALPLNAAVEVELTVEVR
ncbi:MAG: RidA family protein [Planctomycetota bacterium]